jgi:hypothetical protein
MIARQRLFMMQLSRSALIVKFYSTHLVRQHEILKARTTSDGGILWTNPLTQNHRQGNIKATSQDRVNGEKQGKVLQEYRSTWRQERSLWRMSRTCTIGWKSGNWQPKQELDCFTGKVFCNDSRVYVRPTASLFCQGGDIKYGDPDCHLVLHIP